MLLHHLLSPLQPLFCFKMRQAEVEVGTPKVLGVKQRWEGKQCWEGGEDVRNIATKSMKQTAQ